VSWLLPSALAIAAGATLVVLALHFIARSRPFAESLPTARFIPQRPVRARARSIALSDILLLLLRVMAILAFGAAVAAPVFAAARGRVRRILLVDRSRDVGDVREARDSARTLLRAGDVVVAFDSAATPAGNASVLDSATKVDAAGSVSAAMAAALRAASRLSSSSSDSIELVLVSPLVVEEFDEATTSIRAEWPGRIRLVPVRAAQGNGGTPRVESATEQNDGVIAGLALTGVMHPAGNVRIVRGRMTVTDSAWARDSGHAVVHWPVDDSSAKWQPRPTIDAIGGVTSSTGTLIGRFPRVWTLSGTTLARWSDGEPAATEHAVGAGCIRDVSIVFDPAGDITLRASFRSFVARLLEPCGGARRSVRPDSATVAGMAGTPRFTQLATAAAVRDRTTETSPWTPWLLALGAALLVVEMAVRKVDRAAA
jgi:hypothetical protein